MKINSGDLYRFLDNPLGWLKDILSDPMGGLEKFCGKYYGIYPGKVVDNKDPEGRCRVRALCPAIGVTLEEELGESDWALPMGITVDPETGNMSGMFHPPEIGANVWLRFQHGNPAHPVYSLGWVTKKNESDTFDSEDALKKGIRTKTGHFIRMNDDPEDLHLMVAKGAGDGEPSPSFLTMTKDGDTILTNDLGSLLYMNGKEPEVSIMAANSDNEVTSFLRLGDDSVTLSTKSGGAIGIKGKNITTNGDNFVANCGKQFSANAGTVMLGKNATEPAVRGMKFMQWSMIHQHTVTLPGLPTVIGPTPPPVLYNELSPSVFIG